MEEDVDLVRARNARLRCDALRRQIGATRAYTYVDFSKQCRHSLPIDRIRQRLPIVERALGAREPHAAKGGATTVRLHEHPKQGLPVG